MIISLVLHLLIGLNLVGSSSGQVPDLDGPGMSGSQNDQRQHSSSTQVYATDLPPHPQPMDRHYSLTISASTEDTLEAQLDVLRVRNRDHSHPPQFGPNQYHCMDLWPQNSTMMANYGEKVLTQTEWIVAAMLLGNIAAVDFKKKVPWSLQNFQ